MAKAPKKKSQSQLASALTKLPLAIWRGFVRYWKRNWFHKLLVILVALIIVVIGIAYGIARWYMWTQSSKPVVMGASFISDYAEKLGVEPKDTLQAMLTDLDIKHLRLVGYWDKIESTPGQYDFSDLDWQFAMANEHDAKVSLTLGLRQPRWPECHMPNWAKDEPMDVWSVQLKDFMRQVINRYKDNPALDTYQLENEFFLTVFGECPDFTRERLIDEFNFVKSLDDTHPVIITRSNNAWGFPINQPQADLYGVSIYKRVWDITITKRYVEYPFPAWFYGFLGGGGKLLTGKDLFIHELQAEPWPPGGQDINKTSLEEQDKSLSAERLKNRFGYAKGTGLRTIDLWGAEYWYYRKVVEKDPSVWNVAKEQYQIVKEENKRLGD